ncbi:MAG: fumarylacetoacetate hydrolase family protein [Syntrophales bacterium]|nr:fumarylacetoacetate hydrolase family protein [Syntrophales bacterium]
MKICRFESKSKVFLGTVDPENPGYAYIIEGDIFGDWKVTNKKYSITKLLPPVLPPNVFALAFSYGKHAEETGTAKPVSPVVFMKATTSVIGHNDPILLPLAGPEKVDFEGELAVVIGRRAKNVNPSEAMDYVLGFTCANDISARDWQFEKQEGQWTRGKSFDTFCSLGPFLVTKDEIENIHNLRIQTILNGKVMQDASTAELLFSIPAIVSDLSRSLTLLPGTVILTGTPEGVGFTRTPAVFLKEGDTVTVSIEHLGSLTNPVVREK